VSSTPGTGTNIPGTYLYKLTNYLTVNTNETLAGPSATTTLSATGENILTWTATAGASGVNIYVLQPGGAQYLYLTTVASPTLTYTDNGGIAENCNRTLPLTNTTNTTNKVTATLIAPPGGWTTNLYRTTISGQWGSSQIASGLTGTSYIDTGGPTAGVTPPSASRIPSDPTKILLTGGAEVQGILPASMVQGNAHGPWLYAFPFTYSDSGLNTGEIVYTPTIGNVLVDAWIEIDTPFNGTTPLADIGQFLGGNTEGWFKQFGRGPGVDVSVADSDDSISDTLRWGQFNGIGRGTVSRLSDAIIVGTPLTGPPGGHSSIPRRILPAPFTTTDPIQLVVSRTGMAGGTAPGATQGSGTVYLLISGVISQPVGSLSTIEFQFPGPLSPTTGIATWVAPFDCVIVNVTLTLGVGSTPAAQSVIADVLYGTGLNPTYSSIFAAATPVYPEVLVGNQVGSPVVPIVTGFTVGDTLMSSILQSGGGGTPTDHDLTVVLQLQI
jgi:hypothetical protein